MAAVWASSVSAWPSTTSPDGVTRTGRLERSSSVTPSSRSSVATASDTLDWVYDNSSAAAENERSLATVRKI
jgi:hypothetical protein